METASYDTEIHACWLGKGRNYAHRNVNYKLRKVPRNDSENVVIKKFEHLDHQCTCYSNMSVTVTK